MKTAGGFKSLKYSLKVGRKVGFKNLLTTLWSRNTCKACAFGTGGQNRGIFNETKSRIEVCKKNFQAQITDIQPAISAQFFRENSIEKIRQLSPKTLEHLGRLSFPLYKKEGDTHYTLLDHKSAFDLVAKKMRETKPKRSFFYSSGRSSNEASFILQLMARLYGTNNINNCSYYCHQASGEGLKSTLGTGTATIQYSDMRETDTFFIFGANPPSNHPRFLKVLMECRRRGGDVVVINPVKEAGLVKFSVPSDLRSLLFGGTEIASLYLQPKIGGDIALMKGVAKIILEKSATDSNFIEQNSEGFLAYKRDIEYTSWKNIIEDSGLSKDEIESFANIYIHSKKSVFSWGMGLTHHIHGVENIESIVNLAMLRGMVGKKGAGLLPLRGHSNVQGVGSMGVTPELKKEIFQKIEEVLNLSLPIQKGLDTLACLEIATKNEIDFAFMLGGNLYSASPDSSYTENALNQINCKVYLNSTLNRGHLMGIDKEVLILPIAVRDEEKQSTTQESMFSYIRLSDGNITRFKNLHSEVEIISEIALRIISPKLFDFAPFKSHENIRQAIAKVHPAFAEIAMISKEKKEFQLEGRTFHKPIFPTKNTLAQFYVNALPKRDNAQFLMMSTRSEGQFNSIIYEEEGRYRGQIERWIVMMNRNDIKKLGLKENDLVTLYNDTGEMKNIKLREIEIKEGSIATYYPESNILIPITADPRSKTPAFKSVEVKLKL